MSDEQISTISWLKYDSTLDIYLATTRYWAEDGYDYHEYRIAFSKKDLREINDKEELGELFEIRKRNLK